MIISIYKFVSGLSPSKYKSHLYRTDLNNHLNIVGKAFLNIKKNFVLGIMALDPFLFGILIFILR
ncbi:hypothetical protein BpHYR1_033706 [Brachionus plicatilis]|uniref:Uncharacterized protein n=1 Tax=Brachionus plicatilis TaxID=10195 RepID=A0A3M7SKT8_BRAPC|nr:hypothetical protein BpHYR1_033706 [Brachionus plicatilis]